MGAEAPSGGGFDGWGAVAGGAGAAGSTGLITSLFSAFSPTHRKYKKMSRRYQRAQRQAAVDQAVRNTAEFKDRAARGEQELQQNIAGRGFGKSSIMDDDMGFFKRNKDRALAGLATEEMLAGMSQQLLNYEIRTQRLNQYLAYADQLIGVAGGTIAGGL